jgi:hypothetical protein
MKRLFLPLLVNLSVFLAPIALLGADPKPKAAEKDPPTGGEQTQQPVADQAPAQPKADAEKADADADAEKADAEQPKQPKSGARPTSMAIISEPDGLKTLTIHFRWSLFPNATVEVRLVPDPVPKGVEVAPVYFSEHLKGTVRDALYKCLDHPGEGGKTHSFTKDKIVYKMIGRRNSLGNQGVHVQVRPEEGEKLQRSPPKTPLDARVQAPPRLDDSDKDKTEEKPAAAYLQLDTWAVDPETLSLDLARDEFPKAGKLFVWFFRGDQIVWEEQIRWPGYAAK